MAGWHVEIAGGGQPTFTSVINNQIWYCKSEKGFPWDANSFDDSYVFQNITEVSWDNPKTFKMFASKSWPHANGGIVWIPRHITMHNRGIVTTDSSYRAYSDCTTFTQHDLGGPILTTYDFEQRDFGGDLGIRDALTVFYRWGANMANLEVNSYVRDYGWVQWENWQLQNGRYVQKQVSAFNMIVKGGSVAPVFPCGVPTI
jgi:hypothetical protein